MSGGSIPPVGTYRIKQKIILIMDYEKKYKTSLEKAKGFYALCNRCGAKATANFLEDAFPELIESENKRISKNERISKKLIELIHEVYHNTSYITWDEHEDMLAWLEKQAERKTPQWMIDFLDNYRRMIGCSLDYDEARDVDGKILCIKEWLEKQGEQNPAWSEEDERLYQSIIDDTVQENQLDRKQIDWLKSIKQRIGG